MSEVRMAIDVHPLPWRVQDGLPHDGTDSYLIVDANGHFVVNSMGSRHTADLICYAVNALINKTNGRFAT